MRALRVLGFSLRDAWEEMFLVFGLSLLWWLAMLTIVGGPPATAALATVGYRLAQEQRVNLDFARQAFREHFWLSWRLGLANLAVMAIVASNLLFYSQLEGWLRFVTFLIVYGALAWLVILLYAFPLLTAMVQPSLRHVLRNAAVIAFANPLFSLIILLGLGLVTALCIILPILVAILLPALAGIIAARALADRLQAAEERQAAS